MKYLTLNNIAFQKGDFAMQNVSLSLDKNEYFVLLGKTGSGKTQLLESIAGFHSVQGMITLEGKDITNITPEKRNVGFVYQDFALFPNLSVEKNIRFSGQYKVIKDSETFFEDIIEFLALKHLLKRSIEHLSGGEKQRIAIARALYSQPDVLLLDEPLSAIDPTFRNEVMTSLKKLILRYDLTIIHVTHNFREAFYLADKIAIMEQGSIIQQGDTNEVLQHPNSLKTAKFLGFKNIFDASLLDNKTYLYASVDPNMIKISLQVCEADYLFEGRVEEIMHITDHHKVFVQVGNYKFFIKVANSIFEDSLIFKEQYIYLGFNKRDVTYFGAKDEK